MYPPVEVKVPPTIAQKCQGLEKDLADIPGFHDPRAFYRVRESPCSWLSLSKPDFSLWVDIY